MKQGEVWAGRPEGCKRGVLVQAACREGLGWRFAARARTKNMRVMSVTLDVSRLSGWLNSPAACRVARTAHEARQGVDREARGRWARWLCKRLEGKGSAGGSRRGHAPKTCSAWL